VSGDNTDDRVSAVERIIPRPPGDVAPLRTAFARLASKQWQIYIPPVLAGCEETMGGFRFAKGRFIAEMYARACYSMLLVSRRGPISLRAFVRAAGLLPPSRGLALKLGATLLAGMEHLLPSAVHRQLLLMSALMGMLDVVLDDTASSGDKAAHRVASLTSRPCPENLLPAERMIVALAQAARRTEAGWQEAYWLGVLQPAICRYCEAEVLAVKHVPDLTGMGHRWAGIEAAIKGMWYVTGPQMGLEGRSPSFEKAQWNREQRWMADTTLLMQMIDDWVDQDEDRGERLTPVVAGDWNLESAAALYEKTVRDLGVLLDASGIRKPVLKAILADLYRDYLHTAMSAMRAGVAA
jgi:hypothetical protein